MAPGGGGNDGTKTDMERVGFFSELGYTSLGDRYPKEVATLPGSTFRQPRATNDDTRNRIFHPEHKMYAKLF